MRKIICLFYLFCNITMVRSQIPIDTIECTIAYRVDTGFSGFLFKYCSGDCVIGTTKYYLMRNNKFTDTGFNVLNNSDSMFIKFFSERNHIRIFSEKYKLSRSKEVVGIHRFIGFDFYLLRATLIVYEYKPRFKVYSHMWPSNDENLTFSKYGTIFIISQVLNIEAMNVIDD